MVSQIEQLITTLNSLARDRAERDLIATTIRALDARYDLARKMAQEPGAEEIITQLLGRLERAFGDVTVVKGKRILDIACGSNTSKAPASIYINTPFGEKNISTADTDSYTAQFEPWFCRVLLQLGANPVGVDFGDLEGEAFEHYRIDLGQLGALDFLLDRSFDAVQDSRLFGSPEFTAQFPDLADRLKAAAEIHRQEQRVLRAAGRFFGFKLHLLVNDRGELLYFALCPGNTNDRRPVPTLVKHIFGKIFADKGYVSQPLFRQLLETFGIQLITKLEANMKNHRLPLADKLLLRKRAIIETVLDQLKNNSQIEHTRHRSVNNFVVNLVCGLIAHCHQPKKPSLHLDTLPRLAAA
jgi:hypothetical protein